MTINTIDVGSVIPDAKARKIVYSIFGLIGIAIGATQTGYSSASLDFPQWLTIATGVYSYLAAAGFGIAFANARKPKSDI